MSASSALVVVFVLAAPPPLDSARGEGGPPLVWGLTWASSESCIQPGELAERIEAHRGGRLRFGAHPVLRLEGSLRPNDTGFRARLTLINEAGTILGTRQLDSANADCRSLDERLVLVASLLFDSAVPPPTEPPPTPPPLPAPALPEPETPPLSPQPTPRESHPPAELKASPPEPPLRVDGDIHYLGSRPIALRAFYSYLSRPDLVEQFDRRDSQRSAGWWVTGLGVTGSALAFLAWGLGVGCTSYSGSPSNVGSCVAPSVPLLVTGITLGVGALIGLAVAAGAAGNPTTSAEDAQLADDANRRAATRRTVSF